MTDHALTILRTLSRLNPPVEREALYGSVWLTRRVASDHLAELERQELIRIPRRRGPIYLTMKGQAMVDWLEVLKIIVANQPMLRVDLAKKLGMNSQQLKYTIEQLEGDGLIGVGAKRRLVWLTNRGKSLLDTD